MNRTNLVISAVFGVLMLIGVSGLVGMTVEGFGDTPTAACQSPLEARAEADARAWLLTHETTVLRLQRNAVVFNWTVVPASTDGDRPQPGWAFSGWYLARDDGSLRLAGVQRMSGLGG